MAAPMDWIDDELQSLASVDLLRQRVSRTSSQGAQIKVDGTEYINFGSNDYLGLAASAELQAGLRESNHVQVGWGSGASPLILGRHQEHTLLEQELADFLGCEAALLFPSGFAANAGTIPAITGTGDVIFSDAKNHASIIDGCRLSSATVRVYLHSNLSQLEELLKAAGPARRRLIVSDGLFSMDGDAARVAELVALADRYDAMLMIDEAHALGVYGDDGGGVCSQQEVSHCVPIRVGTLSKSFGSHGGFVAGSKRLVEFLANRARSYVFSTAAPVAVAAAARAGLRIARDQPERRQRLTRLGQEVRNALANQGWEVPDQPSHILPIRIGDPGESQRLSQSLRKQGIWVPCIRPPSVPHGESLLRLSLSFSHTDDMINRAMSVFAGLKS